MCSRRDPTASETVRIARDQSMKFDMTYPAADLEFDAREIAASRAGSVGCPAELRHCAATLRCRAENEKVAAKHGKAHPLDWMPYWRAAEIVEEWAEARVI